MSEQQPTFVARKNPGSGWGVDILWPDGETEVVKGFITEQTQPSGLLSTRSRTAQRPAIAKDRFDDEQAGLALHLAKWQAG